MLQSITWLILRKLKKEIILIRKTKHKLERVHWVVVVAVVIALHLESYYFTRRATKEDFQLKTYHHRNCTCEIHTTIYHEQERQSKKKKKITKSDTPVPQCIASRQLHSGSWCFRKAQSHLAPVALSS